MKQALLAGLLLFAPCRHGADALPPDDRNLKFLAAHGSALHAGRGAGAIVQLRGVNLGGWLEWQSWMCPIDPSGTLRDANPGHNGYDFEVRKLLNKRFGQAVAEDLVNAYRDAWISPRDLDNVKSLGFNVVRLTLAYDTMLYDDGTWHPDAFARMDWLVTSAWQRGLYTILDYHAFLPPGANQDGSAGGYWSSDAQKAETVRIWKRIAEHYRGNPAVAMYDLLNEPNNSFPKNRPAPNSSVICDLYDRLYQAIRSVDPDHAIAMEGTWDWHTLRDPARCGYRNVVYSFHWYNWGGKNWADRKRATDRDVQAATKVFRTWNVPVFIGEFNLFGDQDAWKYALEQYDERQLNWTMWTYKNTAGGSNSWGVFTTIPGKAPPAPNLANDSPEEIRRKWKGWATTPETFALNPMLKPLLISGRQE
jgi:aryl-phospho-beta-D-glucosidase BglC (GH1 family)